MDLLYEPRALLGSEEIDVSRAIQGICYILLLSANYNLMHGLINNEVGDVYKHAGLGSCCIVMSGGTQASWGAKLEPSSPSLSWSPWPESFRSVLPWFPL